MVPAAAPGSPRRPMTAPISSPRQTDPVRTTGRPAGFYLLRVAADGRSATVRKVPISWPRTLAPDQQAALSPDGTQLAMDVQACYVGGCHYSGVRVITIATGAVRSWTTHVQGAPFQLSWAGNSRIAFEWQSSSKTPPPSQRTGYRLLDVSGQGGDLLSGPAIATPATTATGSMPAALVTPDGSRVITSMTTAHRDGLLTDTVVGKVIELDAQTGKLLRVLATTTVTGASRNENSQNSAASLEQGCNVLLARAARAQRAGLVLQVRPFRHQRVHAAGRLRRPRGTAERTPGSPRHATARTGRTGDQPGRTAPGRRPAAGTPPKSPRPRPPRRRPLSRLATAMSRCSRVCHRLARPGGARGAGRTGRLVLEVQGRAGLAARRSQLGPARPPAGRRAGRIIGQ